MNLNRQSHGLLIPHFPKVQLNRAQAHHRQGLVLVLVEQLHNLLVHLFSLTLNDILNRRHVRSHDGHVIRNINLASFVRDGFNVFRVLRHPQDTITPCWRSNLFIGPYIVMVRSRLILIGWFESQFLLFESLEDSPCRTFQIKLIVYPQILKVAIITPFHDLLQRDTLINPIIQISKPKHQIMVGDGNTRVPASPLPQRPTLNHLTHRLLPNIKRYLRQNIFIIGIPTSNILPMSR
mmetsp:Transcript_8086/g.11774  ORF Transcript_8086/g.11774 Transcript_8086/m.11774 type:complete len:236 (+) Transcript_8086:1081-1788(+)